VVIACLVLLARWPESPVPAAAPDYVGSTRCAGCHASQHSAWQGSHHARAMQHATAGTVLGDFGDAVHVHDGVRSRFYKQDGRYRVQTDGPDGKPANYEILYTFGVYPLQQYLVEIEPGRLQALSVGWDSRPREQGGQRWFRQYPGEKIDHRDELHWTRASQNWNAMCADCHSTDVRRGYDPDDHRYDTRYREVSVGCESCHGPAARHVEWAKGGSRSDPSKGLALQLNERKGAGWAIDPSTGTARRSGPMRERPELEVCAACHSRRAQFAEGWHAGRAFMDHYLPATLTHGLYFPDGQQRDEVFTWGSWVQSRMHRAGVTCSDCHDPHTQALRAPGNAVCAQCHESSRFDSPRHHRHAQQSSGAQCVECHMPATKYMVVDPRRDHGMRIPRPDLSLSLGTPNACTQCHQDRTAQWAVEALRSWGADSRLGQPHFGTVLQAARRGEPGSAASLIGLVTDRDQPGIVRATALGLLARYPGTSAVDAARRALADVDPLVRHAAVGSLAQLAADQVGLGTSPSFDDPVLAVRLEAARALIAQGPLARSPDSTPVDRALREFERVQRANADRPESLLGLGNLLAARGRLDDAQSVFRSAIALDRGFVPAYVNLAELMRARSTEQDVQALLRSGLREAPRAAALRSALGLSLVREGRHALAVQELSAAYALASSEPRHAYVYAMALKERGRVPEALRVLEDSVEQNGDRELRLAIASLRMQRGEVDAARRSLAALAATNPEDPALSRLRPTRPMPTPTQDAR
jgi:predicted CXXCH cytochrome family protein